MRNSSTILIVMMGFLFMIGACTDKDPLLPTVKLENPKSIHTFCQANPQDTLYSEIFEYQNENLLRMVKIRQAKQISSTTYTYDRDDQLVLETTKNPGRIQRIFYLYNSSGELETKRYRNIELDSNGVALDSSEKEDRFRYENGKLVEKTVYWGGKTTYEYAHGLLSKMIEFNSSGRAHHTTHYEYMGENVKRVVKETAAGTIMQDHLYQYDQEFRLAQIVDRGKVIETNSYDGLKLVEKRRFYHGIDPGYFPCLGNTIQLYEY